MKRHGDRNGHVPKIPTKQNAAAASSHYLNYDQPDTTERQVCLCHVNPYIVNKIQIHINTLSLETPHQLIKGSYPNPPIVHEFRNPPNNVPQRSFLPVILGQHQTRAKHRMREPDTKQGTGYQRRSATTANVRKTRQHRTCRHVQMCSSSG